MRNKISLHTRYLCNVVLIQKFAFRAGPARRGRRPRAYHARAKPPRRADARPPRTPGFPPPSAFNPCGYILWYDILNHGHGSLRLTKYFCHE